MKRFTVDGLEALAFAHNAHVEYDAEENIAVVTVAGVEHYAALPPAVGGAA